MRHNHLAARQHGLLGAQRAVDEFVGKAVKAVAAHALVVIAARQRVGVGDYRDACDGRRCRNRRPARPSGKPASAASIPARLMRLVQRRQRLEVTAAWREWRRRSAAARRRSGPPCTTRWPTPTTRAPAFRPSPASRARRPSAASMVDRRHGFRRDEFGLFAVAPSWREKVAGRADAVDMADRRAGRVVPIRSAKAANLIEEEPALMVRITKSVIGDSAAPCYGPVRRLLATSGFGP